jgi:hypothetical protein
MDHVHGVMLLVCGYSERLQTPEPIGATASHAPTRSPA